MKKILLSIVICGVMILGVVGCRNSKNEFNIGEKSNIKISQNNDVTMKIKDGTLTNTGITIVLTNNSNKNYQYGNPYEIEIKKDGEWRKIKVQLYFTLPALNLPSKESKEIELDWEYGYGKLSEGTYRIIKEIVYEYEEGKYESFNKAVEFTIVKKQNDTNSNKNNVDFHIIKPQVHNDIRFNEYYTADNRTIYLAGNLEEIYVIDNGNKMTLKYYISNTNRTFDRSIETITNKLELKDTLKDGGTKIYKSKEKDITIIKCNTLKNDKNIFIGDYSMEYTDGDCQN